MVFKKVKRRRRSQQMAGVGLSDVIKRTLLFSCKNLPPSCTACRHHTERWTGQSCHWEEDRRKTAVVNVLMLNTISFSCLSCELATFMEPLKGWWGLTNAAKRWWAVSRFSLYILLLNANIMINMHHLLVSVRFSCCLVLNLFQWEGPQYELPLWCPVVSPVLCPRTFMSSWVTPLLKMFETLQEVVSSYPSCVDVQNLPGNRNGLEFFSPFWHRLGYSVSFSTKSQVETCILHIAACGRAQWIRRCLSEIWFWLSHTF